MKKKRKEMLWRWLNILYFGGGIVLSLVGIVIAKIYVKGIPIATFGFWLVIYFVILGVPFMLITNNLFLSRHNQAG